MREIGSALKGAATAGAAYAAYKFPHAAETAIEGYRPIEKEVLALKAAKNLNEDQVNAIYRQQGNLARKYGVKPEETVAAQGAFMKRDYSPEISMALAEQSAILAKALGTTAENASKIFEGVIFGTGQHIHDVAQAKAVTTRFGDMAAIMSKHGAMTDHDIEGLWKYAAASTTTARVSPEQTAAIGMLLKRENIAGDDAGNMLKQLAAHMLRPTNEGHVALQAAGLKYADYLDASKQLNAKNLNLALEENLGKKLSEAATARIQKAIDGGLIADRRALARAAVEAWNEEGPKDVGKAGHKHVSATDLKQIAKQAQKVFDSSQGELHGDKLLDDMISHMSKQQAMAFFGAKQGSKLAAVIMNLETELKNVDDLKNSGGTMDRIAEGRMQGVDAALARTEATYEATRNDFVRANTGVISALSDLATKATGYADALGDGGKQILALGAGLAAALGNIASLGLSALIAKRLLSGGAAGAVAGATTTEVAGGAATIAPAAATGGIAATIAAAAPVAGVAVGVGAAAGAIPFALKQAQDAGYLPKSSEWEPKALQGDKPFEHHDANLKDWFKRAVLGIAPELPKAQDSLARMRDMGVKADLSALDAIKAKDEKSIVFKPDTSALDAVRAREQHIALKPDTAALDALKVKDQSVRLKPDTAALDALKISEKSFAIKTEVAPQAAKPAIDNMQEALKAAAAAGAKNAAPALSPDVLKYFGHQEIKTDVAVQGEVKGEAKISQSISVTASPLLLAKLEEAREVRLPLSGKVGGTMSGGKSAPASPIGGSGFSGINTKFGG